MTDFDRTATGPLQAGGPGPDRCCRDYAAAATSRRGFLRGLAAASGATMFGSAFLQATFAPAAEAAVNSNVIVALSLRGGADMLSLVVPHGDPGYHRARPNIAVPAGSLLKSDAMFGLHPA